MMRTLCGTGLLLYSVSGGFGQSAPVPASFEVASVKVSGPSSAPGGERGGAGRESITPGPAGVTMINVRFKSIVQWAYHMQAIQVTGPGWIESDHFDVVAKAPTAVSNDQLRLMTQALLSQRFKLEFHRETKVMPAYVVTVGKNGHKLKPSEGEGEMQIKPTANGGKMVASFSHVTLAQMSEMLTSPLQGVVVDETGLKGAWDFTLDASSFAMTQPTGIDEAISMVIQAINEQLGIKIEQKKVPAELLVVDRAERVPVGN